MELPLFPLHTVLFPGGLLPLKIFEQRYMEMAKICLRDASAFGVCAISEGREVGAPAVPARVGCMATIAEWDMPQLGVLHILARGTQRFSVRSYRDNGMGLLIATVKLIENEPISVISTQFTALIEIGSKLQDYTNGQYRPTPAQLADAVWLGYRLSELLPLPLELKQELLELTDPHERLRVLHGLIAPRAQD